MSNITKADHPWRNYANKKQTKEPAIDNRLSRKPLQIFLTELSQNWGQTFISIRYRGKFDRYYLLELPDNVVANWVNQMIRNNYSSYNPKESSEEEILDELGS